MQIHTTNKIFHFIIFIFVQFIFVGCNEKTVKLSEIFNSDLSDGNLIASSVNKKIVTENIEGMGHSSESIELQDATYYISSYEFTGKHELGKYVVLSKLVQKKNERYLILKDIVHFDSEYGLYVSMVELSYGEKNKHGYYKTDKEKFGIFEYDISKSTPYYQKIIPRYIITIKNEKIIYEKPENIDYFIYLYDEI